MKPPKTFKANGKTYTIEVGGPEYELLREGAEGYLRGQINTISQRMFIGPEQPEDGRRETVLHELLHVAFDAVTPLWDEIKKSDDMEETIIRLLAMPLFQMLTENKRLADYILGRTS